MNKKANFTKRILCIALIMAVVLTVVGCAGGTSEEPDAVTAVIQTDGETLGTGDTVFPLTVVDGDGKEIHAEIHTKKETVGEALEELGVIAGEESVTGLYVKTVNGITADYDEDGVYWAFYINGAYAQAGVDSTPINEGEEYAFKIEQG